MVLDLDPDLEVPRMVIVELKGYYYLLVLVCLLIYSNDFTRHNQFLTVLALVLYGHSLIFFPSSLRREPTIRFSASKVEMSSIAISKGFCLHNIFLLIGSCFCWKLALLIVSCQAVNYVSLNTLREIRSCKNIFLYFFWWYIWIICNSSVKIRPNKIINVISQIPIKTINISCRKIFQPALFVFFLWSFPVGNK